MVIAKAVVIAGCLGGVFFLTSVCDPLHLGNKLWLSHCICLVTKSDPHNTKYANTFC